MKESLKSKKREQQQPLTYKKSFLEGFFKYVSAVKVSYILQFNFKLIVKDFVSVVKIYGRDTYICVYATGGEIINSRICISWKMEFEWVLNFEYS